MITEQADLPGADLSVLTARYYNAIKVWRDNLSLCYYTGTCPNKVRHQTHDSNSVKFLPIFTARRHASAVCAVIVCPYVRPSVHHKSVFC